MDGLDQRVEDTRFELGKKADKEENQADMGNFSLFSDELERISAMIQTMPDVDRKLGRLQNTLKGKVDRTEFERYCLYDAFLIPPFFKHN